MLIRMKKVVFIGSIALLFQACLFDNPIHNQHLVKDFNLSWWSEPWQQSLYKNTDHNEYGGVEIIPETVFAIGYNENFIIAKQHPNNDDTISWNNIHEHETWQLDSLPSDTLGEQSNYVKIEGQWHGISNGRNTRNDLFPDKKITNYYILDIREYPNPKWRAKEQLYQLQNEAQFQRKRKELGLASDLDFSIIEKELE